jgi:hypothetical protein
VEGPQRQSAGEPGVSAAPADLEEARVELNSRCDSIEECYEFMLAYAGQGLESDAGSSAGSQIRDYLRKCDTALTGLAEFLTGFVKRLSVESMAPYAAFMAVIDRDARDAQAAVGLVLAQSSISSQLVDNLNASIHLRALLTDLFLIDEVFKSYRRAG